MNDIRYWAAPGIDMSGLVGSDAERMPDDEMQVFLERLLEQDEEGQ